jgi:predicted dehydrogenase
VSGLRRNVGGEPVPIEDAAVVAIELSSGAVATAHSGFYLDASYQGSLHFWMTEGWLTLDPVECSVAWQRHDVGAPEFWSGSAPHQTRDFLQAVFEGEAIADDGQQVLRTVFAAYESSASGRAVTIH